MQAIEPVYVEVPKGSVAFHHGLTVHLAEANAADRTRAVHTIIYFPDGSTRGHRSGHFAVDRGEHRRSASKIDSDTTPDRLAPRAGRRTAGPDARRSWCRAASPTRAPIPDVRR